MQIQLGSLLQDACKKGHCLNNVVGQGGKGGRVGVIFRRPSLEKLIELLNEREFHERFCILNGVFVQLADGDPTSTEKAAQGAIFLARSNSTRGSAFLSRLSSSNSCITPKFFQPTSTLTSSGC